MNLEKRYKVIVVSLLFSVSSCQFSAAERPPQTGQLMPPKTEESAGLSEEQILEIAYIGNMGVLLESDNKTILFDGLHEQYKPDYLYPTDEMVNGLTTGVYEGFSALEVVMFTHKHGDHFSAKLTADFLSKNSESIVVAPAQICEELDASLVDQLKAINYIYETQQFVHKGIKIEGIRCDHSNQARHSSIQNVAFLVELNGFKILHIGDTYWNFSTAVFEALNLENIGVDIAILPYWMLEEKDAKEQVNQLINPKKIIATHIPPNFDLERQNWLRKEYANIEIFTELRQTIAYRK